MKTIKLYFSLTIFLISNTLYAQFSVTPAGPQENPILLKGGTAHIGNGQVIENSVIGFTDGKLDVVADATNSRIDESQYEVIDVSGKHIYPGFILPATNLGLSEVGQVRHTRDYNERGDMNPNVRSLIAYNTDSELIPTMRFNGILLAQITPLGGIISGSSSIVNLDAWNWEDAAFKIDDGIHLNWPNRLRGDFDFSTFTFSLVKNEDYDEDVVRLDKIFKDARSYGALNNPVAPNVKLEAMQGLFDGSKRLYIHTNRAKEIIESIKFAKKQGVQRIVLVGAREIHMVLDFVKDENIPVILANIHRTPSYSWYDVDLPYKLPSMLHDAGIKFCIGTSSSSTAMIDRNLSFTAGTAAAHGLSKEEALRAITLSTAEILGIDDSAGSLETGKEATLFVTQGDALDMSGNQLDMAFISGRNIEMEGMQQELYQKFKEKYGQE